MSIAEVIVTELRPWIGRPPATDPPPVEGYRLIRSEKLDLMRVSLLGLLLAPVWMVIFGFLVTVLSGQEEVSGTISIVNAIVGLAFVVIVVVLHELIHGAAVLASGKLPSFGAGPGFFYTTCHEPLSWRSYVAVVLAPFVVINGAAVAIAVIWPGATGWALFVSTINMMGAGGDIWMFVRLLSAPRTGLVMDLASGFAIYDVAVPVEQPQATTASSIDS